MEQPASKWCYDKRDEALENSDVDIALRYHELGEMWEKREKSKEGE